MNPVLISNAGLFQLFSYAMYQTLFLIDLKSLEGFTLLLYPLEIPEMQPVALLTDMPRSSKNVLMRQPSPNDLKNKTRGVLWGLERTVEVESLVLLVP